MQKKSYFGIGVLGCLVALTGCAMTSADGQEAPGEAVGTTTEALTGNHIYVASVTGGVAIKRKLVFTETITAPRVRQGKVSFGPSPYSCTTRSDGVQACLYTMAWKGVVLDDFSVNGHTVRGLTVDTLAPVPVTVAQGKFTIPANTARFILRGSDNGNRFQRERTMDSTLTGTFTPGGAFTISGVVTRTISGPIGINVRAWGNINLSGTAADTTPTCTSSGGGQFSCQPGAQPSGSCRATKLHRYPYACNGSVRSPDQVIDLVATGYGNYECANRFIEQCVDDGSFDSYYLEWCDYSCSP